MTILLVFYDYIINIIIFNLNQNQKDTLTLTVIRFSYGISRDIES